MSLLTCIFSSSLIETCTKSFTSEESPRGAFSISGIENSRNECSIADVASNESSSLFMEPQPYRYMLSRLGNVLDKSQPHFVLFSYIVLDIPSGLPCLLRIRVRMSDFIQTFWWFWDLDLKTSWRFRESTTQNSLSLYKSCDSRWRTWKDFKKLFSKSIWKTCDITPWSWKLITIFLRDTIFGNLFKFKKLEVLQASGYSIALSGMMQGSKILGFYCVEEMPCFHLCQFESSCHDSQRFLQNCWLLFSIHNVSSIEITKDHDRQFMICMESLSRLKCNLSLFADPNHCDVSVLSNGSHFELDVQGEDRTVGQSK
jgi:hypothetical protein